MALDLEERVSGLLLPGVQYSVADESARREFLNGIEPSERIYHHGDPAAAIRAALRCELSPAAR